jgi:hypothetical protein
MTTSDEKQKRKVHRSPSYPAFDLGEAIAKAEAVYKNERRSATTAEVIASHMGYSTATGPGGRAVSALRQYGLIEEASGKYRLSDTGYTLVHFGHESAEWKAALLDAAKHPTLFRELLTEYPDDLPSDATLRTDLLKREFNPGSIPDVVNIFRSTMSLLFPENMIHNEGGEVSMESTHQADSVRTELSKKAAEKFVAPSQISTPVGKNEDGVPVFAHVRFDGALRKEYVASLKKYLDFLEGTLQ